jgi:Protein of unknown function (DUF3485)
VGARAGDGCVHGPAGLSEGLMNSKIMSYAPPVVCGILLLGMTALDPMRIDWESAQPYQARARAAIAAVPLHIGLWTGQDEIIQKDALDLLRPNATLQRRYVLPGTSFWADILIVQCGDTRDMLGHYPPICYPSAGWKKVRAEEQDWRTSGMTIPGTEYEFTKPRGDDQMDHLIVRDFFVLPSGTLARDKDALEHAAKSYQQLAYGVAQIQLIFDARTTARQRDAIFSVLVGANASLIDVMKSGGIR